MGLLDFDYVYDPGGLTEWTDWGGDFAYDLGFDPGGFDLPESFWPAEAADTSGYAHDLSGLTFDTTTGQVMLPSGQPFSDEALERMAQGIEYQVGGAGYGDLVRQTASGIQRSQRFTQDVQRALGMGGTARGVLGTVNEWLNTPLGRAVATALTGGAGLGAARWLAGEAPELNLPTYTEAPETTALRAAAFPGQMTIAQQLAARAGREAAAEAEQAPGERALRLTALDRMGGFLPGGQTDPIVAGLRAEAVRALSPDYSDPLVEEAIRREEARLMNQLVRQYGGLAAAETSTPGTDVLLQAAREKGVGRAAARRAAIGTYVPGAIQAEQGIQAMRRANLADTERLSRFGMAGVPETATALMTLGGNPEAARMTNLALQQQQALAGFQSRAQERQQMAQAVGGIAGQVAQAIGRQTRSPLEDLAIYNFAGQYL